jgi:hypothetical protein
MRVTELVSQRLISSLNEAACQNAFDMSVTPLVSQPAIAPYSAVAAPGSFTQAAHADRKFDWVIAVAASTFVSARRMTQMDKTLSILRYIMVDD